MTDRLGNPHIAALLALMGVAREVSNTELEAIAGFRIDGKVRVRLNELRLVTSRREGNKAFTHELTEQGWAWCAEELLAERPAQARPLGGALYAILGGVNRYLRRANLRLADVFQPAGGSASLESLVYQAYRKLARERGDWVRLADLRPLLNGASTRDTDEVLKRLSRAKRAHLAPQPDRKALTEADHVAAVRIGGEGSHLIAIEGP